VQDLTEEVIQAWHGRHGGIGSGDQHAAHAVGHTVQFLPLAVKRRLLAVNPIMRMDRPPHQPRAPDGAGTAPHGCGGPRGQGARASTRCRTLPTPALHRHAAGVRGPRSVWATWTESGDSAESTRKVGSAGHPGARARDAVPACVRAARAGANLGSIARRRPLFWSTWGRKAVGKIRQPMTGKNVWRLCKVYGRRIGYPTLKPHDLRHGVAMEVLGQRNNLEEVRALLGHTRLETTRSTPRSGRRNSSAQWRSTRKPPYSW